MTDVWALQQQLMKISDQHLPENQYELNKGVIMYYALNLEEMAELATGLNKAIAMLPDSDAKFTLQLHVKLAGQTMHMASEAIREILKENDIPALTLPKEIAIEIADATTDVAVVNAGFALSVGLDGAACYDEVVGSNLSKANPETGVIDKTPDGKWIKGSDYRQPNLDKVLYGE